MSIEDLNKFKQVIIENFRWIKLEKDYAQFQLILFQLLDLISHYEKLINLQKELQDKHYQAIKQLENSNLIDDYDYVKWYQQRDTELSSWKRELDLLTEYKHQISTILEQIEDGAAERALAEQEEEFLK